MLNSLRRVGNRYHSIFVFAFVSCCLLSFYFAVLAQQGKGNSTANSEFTATISPEISKVNSSNDQGLDKKSFSSTMNARIVYSPANVDGRKVFLYIDEKTGDSIDRYSYDLTLFLEKQQGTHDVGTAPPRIVAPQISSDGSRVIFESLASEEEYQIYSLDLKTDILTKITKNLISYRYKSISPDGSYIAFIEGGDAFGNVYQTQIDAEYYTGPLKLFVADAEGKNKYLVAQGDLINGELQWNSKGELFYGLGSKPEVKKPSTLQIPNLDIYSFDVNLKKSTLLVKNGVMPYPSADGKGLVFFGPSDQTVSIGWDNWRSRPPVGASMCYSTREGTQRTAFEPVGRTYPLIKWFPDCIQFVSLRQATSNSRVTGELKLWNVETQDTRRIAELELKDSSKFLLSPYSRFNIIDANPSKITVSKLEFIGFTNDKGTMPHFRSSVVTINPTDGAIITELSAVDTLSYGYYFDAKR